MGHPQPPTPTQTNNSTANGVVNNNVQPKRTKPMDMRFHWLRCKMAQKQFCFHWRPGTSNLADYWTKHHSGVHHKKIRREILTPIHRVVTCSSQASQKVSWEGVLNQWRPNNAPHGSIARRTPDTWLVMTILGQYLTRFNPVCWLVHARLVTIDWHAHSGRLDCR